MNPKWWLNNQLYQLMDMCEYWYDLALKNQTKSTYYFARAEFYFSMKQSIEEQMRHSTTPVLFNHITSVVYEKIRNKWPN